MDKMPSTKTVPQYEFTREKIILYGKNKIGKTSLVAAMPFDILFIATEAGHRKVSCFRYPSPESGRETINDWQEFKDVLKAVKAEKRFPMVCVDNLDCLWITYRDHFLKANNVTHEGDIPFKGWTMIARGFASEFLSLQNMGIGYFLICGERDAGKGERHYFEPTIYRDNQNEVWNSTVGIADMVLYLDLEMNLSGVSNDATRVIRTVGTDRYFAGGRIAFPEKDKEGNKIGPDITLVNGDPEKSARRLINAYKLSAQASADKALKPAPKLSQAAPQPTKEAK